MLRAGAAACRGTRSARVRPAGRSINSATSGLPGALDFSGRVVVSTSTDPFFNLALEEVLTDGEIIPAAFLYTNSPCIVLGRNQNPWKEARVEEILVVRRRSGGGTVFHDVGNLNWSVFSGRSSFDKVGNAERIRHALRERFGLPIMRNERNDLTLDGRKVSGSAYRLSGSTALHHGTLLVSANLSALRGILHPRVDLEGKWIDSVPAPGGVSNLADADPGITLQAVIDALAQALSPREVLQLGPESLERGLAELVAREAAALSAFDWTFGNTRSFVQRFGEWGSVVVDEGRVVDVLGTQGQRLPGAQSLVGLPYRLAALQRGLLAVSGPGTGRIRGLSAHFEEGFGREMRR